MNEMQYKVECFMKDAKQELPQRPEVPSTTICRLREALIIEETNELCEALADRNLVEIADGIGDLLYVVLGTAIACGIDIEPIFNEIHRSNMSKFIDGVLREDGKLVKGPSYSPANLKPILDLQ